MSALAFSLGLAVAAASPTAPECDDLLPAVQTDSGPRSLEADDLVRLRDIGPPDIVPGEGELLAVSPGGRQVAFHLRRANSRTNDYCQGLVVLDLAPGALPRLVDQGGALLRVSFDFRGKAAFPSGTPRLIAPRWHPDGRSVAYLKQAEGGIRVWRANADGSGARPISPAGMNVEDFRFSRDGGALLFSSRVALAAARAAIAREAFTGFHYDDRYAPVSSSRPFPPEGDRPAFFALDLAEGTARPATEEEIAQFAAAVPGPRGAHLRVAPDLATRRAPLSIDAADGRTTLCPDPVCDSVDLTPFWLTDGRAAFLRREGWAREETAFYAWTPGAARAQRLFVTTDKLAGCATSALGLLCLREGSTTPRRLELFDPATGTSELLFDPNPEYERLSLGRAERLRWRNDRGLEVIGDLVYPVGYQAGRRYPLIVVQYDTRGFLRGGTGDDYPIQLFANRGYAVLSVSRPRHIADLFNETDPVTRARRDIAGLAERRSSLSAVEEGVRLAISRGLADPARIGLTGMSDGASTGAFALIHSNLFAAMAMSHCCFDTNYPMRLGPVSSRHFYDIGYPRLIDDGDAFWRDYSVRLNARRITVPTLFQIADDEYWSALESFTALRETGAPADLFVFPDEHHVKYQPAHRLAIYTRSLAWFDYWLRGIRDPAPERQAELQHWDRLREEAARRDQITERTPDQ